MSPELSDTASPADRDRSQVPENADEVLAEAAYTELQRLFVAHIGAFMREAGRYIIDTFYGGDARLALTKRGAARKQNSLNMLISKLRSGANDPTTSTPSVPWFYKAVLLAAHESICCERRSLSTFINLGLSHKLLLLSVPKLTTLRSDADETILEAAFDEKERLAKIAIDERLSVRDFALRIKMEHPGATPPLRLDALSGRDELRRQPPETLRKLYNTARVRIEEGMTELRRCRQAMDDIGAVLAEAAGEISGGALVPAAGGRFCAGCATGCLHCPAMAAEAVDPLLKAPAGVSRWEILPSAVDCPRQLMDGPVALPAGHDIFPGILDAAVAVMGRLLRAGNEVVITCRPRLSCIRALLAAGACFKDRIEVRCVIGAADSDVLSFWEPGGPGYEERKAALAHAFDAGFRTSAAAAPMLDPSAVAHLVRDLTPFVTEAIWLDIMPQAETLENISGVRGLETQAATIRHWQTPETLAARYAEYRENPLVRWGPAALERIFGPASAVAPAPPGSER